MKSFKILERSPALELQDIKMRFVHILVNWLNINIPDLYFYTNRLSPKFQTVVHVTPEGLFGRVRTCGEQCTNDCKHTLIVH